MSADDLVDVTELKKKVSQAMKVCNKTHRSSVSLCVSDVPSLSVAEEEEEVNTASMIHNCLYNSFILFSSYSFSHKCPIHHECFWFYASLLTHQYECAEIYCWQVLFVCGERFRNSFQIRFGFLPTDCRRRGICNSASPTLCRSLKTACRRCSNF